MMHKLYEKKLQARLTVAMILMVALIVAVALSTMLTLQYTLIITGVIPNELLQTQPVEFIVMFALTSAIMGLALIPVLDIVVLRPIRRLITGMKKLEEGDFSTRIHFRRSSGLRDLATSFNNLATELENTEILRSDFVNEFSHEIKTPIVSISGLVTLLKNDDLPPEKRKQYLDIIEEEVNRLTDMTTNILNNSKYEKQGILTDKTTYNLSEQIRGCMLLLEKKWDKKNLEPNLELEEYNIYANEDMLKQVWINLIDNAIKFSEEGKELRISVSKIDNDLKIDISNYGIPIPDENTEKIFIKFYQQDKKDSREGNGIGLSIVKHVVTLHQGTVKAKSLDGITTFTVILPSGISE